MLIKLHKIPFSVGWCLLQIVNIYFHCFSCYSPSPEFRQRFWICACSKQWLFWPWTQLTVQDLVCTTDLWYIFSVSWIIHQMPHSNVFCLQHKVWQYESKIFGISELLRSQKQNISVHKKSKGINVTYKNSLFISSLIFTKRCVWICKFSSVKLPWTVA